MILISNYLFYTKNIIYINIPSDQICSKEHIRDGQQHQRVQHTHFGAMGAYSQIDASNLLAHARVCNQQKADVRNRENFGHVVINNLKNFNLNFDFDGS